MAAHVESDADSDTDSLTGESADADSDAESVAVPDEVVDAYVAAKAAVECLGADDCYGKMVSEWFNVVDDYLDSDCLTPQPPVLDTYGHSDVL